MFVMGPTLDKVYQEAYHYTNAISFERAVEKAEAPMRQFMLKANAADLIFVRLPDSQT